MQLSRWMRDGFLMDLALRPMSTSQLLDRTFYLYRNNFVLFAGIAIITPALQLIVQLIQLRIFGLLVMPQQPENMTPQFIQALLVRAIVSLVVISIITIVGTTLASSATAFAVSMVHLNKTTTIVESYGKVKSIFWRILGLLSTIMLYTFSPLILCYLFLLGLFIGMAFMLKGGNPQTGFAALVLVGSLVILGLLFGSIVWMFFALCRYALAVAACMLEKLPVRQSITRSKFLTHGAKGSIFGIILLTGIMKFILAYALQLPALLINRSVFLTSRTHLSMASTAWIYIANFLGGAMAGPITTIALVLVYYDQRVRKEAFDLQLMMESAEQTSPHPTLTAASGMS
jgi:hypothetical protein